jgi:hypothetical protein
MKTFVIRGTKNAKSDDLASIILKGIFLSSNTGKYYSLSSYQGESFGSKG